MLRMTSNPAGFNRIRTRAEALLLSEGDRAGPLLRELDREHIRQVRRAFASKGSTTGLPWQPWSPAYAAWRRKNGLGRTMLRLTGTMFGKMVSPSHGDHIARWVSGWLYQFGARDELAFIHMGTGPRTVMPYRTAIDKTAADHKRFTAVLVTFYRKRLRQVIR